MPTDTQTLKSLALFAELTHEEREQLAPLMHPMKVAEGELLTRSGDTANTFYVTLSGNFMLCFKDDRAVTLHNKGDIMGWSTVVTPFQYRGTSMALTDGEVLSMSGQEFLRLIQENAVLSEKIMKKINTVVKERMPLVTGEGYDEG